MPLQTCQITILHYFFSLFEFIMFENGFYIMRIKHVHKSILKFVCKKPVLLDTDQSGFKCIVCSERFEAGPLWHQFLICNKYCHTILDYYVPRDVIFYCNLTGLQGQPFSIIELKVFSKLFLFNGKTKNAVDYRIWPQALNSTQKCSKLCINLLIYVFYPIYSSRITFSFISCQGDPLRISGSVFVILKFFI